jgi:Uma2 family endonuclease
MTISTPPLSPERDDGPRAPTQAEWDAMSPAERVRAAAALPTYIPNEELGAMDGLKHQRARNGFEGALRAHGESTGRVMFVAGQLAVYFPGERRIQPDVFVVTGVAQSDRDSWVVSMEERAPEFVLEVLAQGHREKDLKNNVTRYARLGIREYFLADLRHHRLYGWRLGDPAIRLYTALVPQLGRIRSEVLGLDVKLEGDRVRLYLGSSPLLEPEEIAERVRDDLNDMQMLKQEADERAADAESRAIGAETRAAAEAKARAEAEAAKQAAEAAKQAAEAAKQAAESRANAAEAELAQLRALLAGTKPGDTSG